MRQRLYPERFGPLSTVLPSLDARLETPSNVLEFVNYPNNVLLFSALSFDDCDPVLCVYLLYYFYVFIPVFEISPLLFAVIIWSGD